MIKLRIGKRGDTTDWTGKNIVSLIISIIGIVIIILAVYGIVKFFFINQDNQNAENFISDIYGKINLLEDGENNTFLVRGVEGWYLVGWNKNERLKVFGEIVNDIPDKCFPDNCLCLCKYDSDIFPTRSEFLKVCQSDGICKPFTGTNVSVSVDYSRLSDSQTDLNYCAIKLENNLIAVEISKSSDNIKVTYYLKDEDVSEGEDYRRYISGPEFFGGGTCPEN